ncbi:MAG: hypothetical protein M1608_09545 [Candidatus Omnitrophica bacterium]|nr:hypothetical protein [Candidatus Omnitrophota bacterium]
MPTTVANEATYGGSDYSKAEAIFGFGGDNNDIRFEAKTNGASFNGIKILLVDSRSGNVADASYDPTLKILTINLDSGVTTANTVVNAIRQAGGNVAQYFTGNFLVDLKSETAIQLERDASARLEDTALGGGLFGLGDLNRDGYADFAVSRLREDGGTASGAILIFYGSPGYAVGSDQAPVQDASSAADIVIRQYSATQGLGSVSIISDLQITAGDFNHDGKQDLVIGRPVTLQTTSLNLLPDPSEILSQDLRGHVYLFNSVLSLIESAPEGPASLELDRANIILEGEGSPQNNIYFLGLLLLLGDRE